MVCQVAHGDGEAVGLGDVEEDIHYVDEIEFFAEVQVCAATYTMSGFLG